VKVVRHRDRPDRFADVFLQFLLESICPRLTSLQDDVRDQGLALHWMRLADDGGLGDLIVPHQGGLDLNCPDPMTSDVARVSVSSGPSGGALANLFGRCAKAGPGGSHGAVVTPHG